MAGQFVLLLLAGVILVSSTTDVDALSTLQFESPVHNLTVRADGPAELLCKVTYNGTDRLFVKWIFRSGHTPISSNEEILVAPLGDNRGFPQYSIEHYDNAPVYVYNLKLYRALSRDSGVYECRAEAGNAFIYQFVSLNVLTAEPTTAPPVVEPSNFTDCCVAQNVSTECLPLCASATADVDLLVRSKTCFNEALRILKCASDGRNHISCCHRRGVNDSCLDLCQLTPEYNGTITQACRGSVDDFMSCFSIGQAILPSPPSQFYAVAQTSSTIYLSWSKPEKNGDAVTEYRLLHRSAQNPNSPFKIRMLAGNSNSYTLRSIGGSNLQPGTTYELLLVAYTRHGSSAPSYTVSVTTFLEVDNSNLDISGCCHDAGVSDSCTSSMCDLKNELTATNAALCYRGLNNILNCYSDSADHSACCRNIGLPDMCLSICSHGTQHIRWDQMQCLQYLEATRSCFLQGSPLVPGPPTRVRLGQIEKSTAQVLWNAPSKYPEKVLKYKVTYAIEDTFMLPLVIGTRFNAVKLVYLASKSRYWVQVTSVGVNGSSVPSSRLYFDTDPVDGSWTVPTGGPPTATTGPPDRNITACCLSKGVSSYCAGLCNLNIQLSTVLLEPGYLVCLAYASEIATCATDGGDHTPCCKERGVSTTCLPVCSLTADSTLDPALAVCLEHFDPIKECILTGRLVLPGIPENLYVTGRTTSTIGVGWTRPVISPAGIDGYLVNYKTDLDGDFVGRPFVNTSSTNATHYTFEITGLTPDTIYFVSVTAFNTHGSSVPSPSVKVETLPTNVPPPVIPGNASQIDNTACCKRAGVRTECLVYCGGNVSVPSTSCFSDVSRILSCISGGVDHVPCCEDSNVPTECLGLCRASSSTPTSRPVCLSHAPSVFTCFHAGAALFPSPPSRFSNSAGWDYITLHWDPPIRNWDNVVYEVYFKKYRAHIDTQKVFKNITTTFFKVTNLEHSTTYEVYAIAVNSFGASLPSSTFYAMTANNELPRVLRVDHAPTGVVYEGTPVVFDCKVRGVPVPTVSWLGPRRRKVSNSSSLTIENVDRDDRGMYTCVAVNNLGRDALGSVLDVLYAPRVHVDASIITVRPGLGSVVKLKCFFEGNVTHVWWTKRNSPVTAGGRYKVRSGRNYNLRGTELYLGIADVKPVDLTMYTCHGNNSMGSARGVILLQAPPTGPAEPRPTSEVLPPVPDVRECCERNNVADTCLVACAFDVDMSQIPPDRLASCANESATIINCQADGRDHSQCCKDAGVADVCMSVCHGEPLKLASAAEAMLCAGFTQVMSNCVQMGHERIPSAPLNINATFFYSTARDSGLRVTWTHPAKNRHFVQRYHIFYQAKQSSNVHEASVPNTVFDYIISSSHLTSGKVYKVWLRASNHYGSSLPSGEVFVTYQGVLPSIPLNVLTKVYDSVNIKVWWTPPTIRGHFDVTYQVNYRVLPQNPKLKTNFLYKSTYQNHYLLYNMSADSTYEIYVQAVNVYGAGPPTQSVFAKTGEPTVLKPKPTASSQLSKSVQIGIGVGVAVIVLVAIVIGVMVAFWYYRIRTPRSGGKESVSFENPSYYARDGAQPGQPSVQISGLPGENVYSEADSGAPADGQSQDQSQDQSHGLPDTGNNSQFQYERLSEVKKPEDAPVYDNLNIGDIDVQTHL